MTFARLLVTAPRWSAGLLLGLAGLAAIAATWSDQLADLGGDSATYVLTARHYAPYVPHDEVAAGIASNSQFPPLYPLLLVATAGAADLRFAHAATTLCLLAALVALHAWLLALPLPRRLALVTTGIFAVMPGTWWLLWQLRSEGLYLALSLGGIVLLARAGRSGARRDWWIATALLGAAVLSRSAGVALLPALVIALLRWRPRGGWWMPPAMLLPALLWGALQERQTYGSVLQTLVQGSPEALVSLIILNAQALALGLVGNLAQTHALLPVAAPFLALAAVVLATRFRRAEPDAWYVAAYLAMVIVWPYPSESQRLAWVVVPLLLGYAALGGVTLAGRLPPGAAAGGVRWAVPAGLAVIVVPAFVLALQRWSEPADRALARLPEWYLADARAANERARTHLDLVRAVSDLGAQVPRGECVYAITPVVGFYTGREARLPLFEGASDAQFEQWVGEGACRHFLLLAAHDGVVTKTDFYPRDRLGERLEILEVRTTGAGDALRVVAALAVLK